MAVTYEALIEEFEFIIFKLPASADIKFIFML